MKRRISNGAIAAAVLCLAVGSFQILRAASYTNGFGGTGSTVATPTRPGARRRRGPRPGFWRGRSRVLQRQGRHRGRALHDRSGGGGQRRSDRRGRFEPGDLQARRSQHQNDRSEGPDGHPGLIDNHLHLLRAGNTWELELRWDGVDSSKRAIEMLRARAKSVRPGWMGVQHRWLGHGAVHRRQEAVHARGARRDRAGQSGRTAGVLLSGLPEQPRAEGIRNRSWQARSAGLRRGSILRDAAGKPTGIIRGDIAATRPVAARMPKLPPDRLEASTEALVQGHESRGPHLLRCRRLQRRRARDHAALEGAESASRPRLLHRRRGRRLAGSGRAVRFRRSRR